METDDKRGRLTFERFEALGTAADAPVNPHNYFITLSTTKTRYLTVVHAPGTPWEFKLTHTKNGLSMRNVKKMREADAWQLAGNRAYLAAGVNGHRVPVVWGEDLSQPAVVATEDNEDAAAARLQPPENQEPEPGNHQNNDPTVVVARPASPEAALHKKLADTTMKHCVAMGNSNTQWQQWQQHHTNQMHGNTKADASTSAPTTNQAHSNGNAVASTSAVSRGAACLHVPARVRKIESDDSNVRRKMPKKTHAAHHTEVEPKVANSADATPKAEKELKEAKATADKAAADKAEAEAQLLSHDDDIRGKLNAERSSNIELNNQIVEMHSFNTELKGKLDVERSSNIELNKKNYELKTANAAAAKELATKEAKHQSVLQAAEDAHAAAAAEMQALHGGLMLQMQIIIDNLREEMHRMNQQDEERHQRDLYLMRHGA